MKAVLWILPLLLVPQDVPAPKDGPAPQGPAADDPEQKRIQQLLAWFGDRDEQVRQSARASLVAMGKEAVPAIEKKLSGLGALPLAILLSDLHRNLPSADALVLPSDEVLTESKADKDLADRYARLKYAEALAWAKKENFQKAYDIAHSLHFLEPKSAVAEKVNQLRRFCENKITQTTLIEAKIVPEKPALQIGEPAGVTIRLKNVFKMPITMKYEGGRGNAPEGLVVLEIEAAIATLKGESASRNRHQEFSFEGEIALSPGETWERRLTLDTAFELPEDLEIQTVTVNAWTQPSKIDTEGANLLRRLQFDTATVRLVPKRYAHFIEKPLEWLSKTIETDRPAQETWVCAQLLAEGEKRKGAEILVQAMAKTENPDYRPALARMLTHLTGEKYGPDPKKWSDWLARPPEKKKK